MYARMTRGLNEEQRSKLDGLVIAPVGGQMTGFTLLKKTPGPAKLKYIREWSAHLEPLDALLDPKPFLEDIPGLGYLFKRRSTDDRLEDLLIFITPHILEAAPPRS